MLAGRGFFSPRVVRMATTWRRQLLRYEILQQQNDIRFSAKPLTQHGRAALTRHFHNADGFKLSMGICVGHLIMLAERFIGTEPIELPYKYGKISPCDALAVSWYLLRNVGPLYCMEEVVGYHESRISVITNAVCDMICTRIGPYLYQSQWVTSRRDIYAKTLQDKGMQQKWLGLLMAHDFVFLTQQEAILFWILSAPRSSLYRDCVSWWDFDDWKRVSTRKL